MRAFPEDMVNALVGMAAPVAGGRVGEAGLVEQGVSPSSIGRNVFNKALVLWFKFADHFVKQVVLDPVEVGGGWCAVVGNIGACLNEPSAEGVLEVFDVVVEDVDGRLEGDM